VDSHPFHDETVKWMGHTDASRWANWTIRSLPDALSFVADGESIAPAQPREDACVCRMEDGRLQSY